MSNGTENSFVDYIDEPWHASDGAEYADGMPHEAGDMHFGEIEAQRLEHAKNMLRNLDPLIVKALIAEAVTDEMSEANSRPGAQHNDPSIRVAVASVAMRLMQQHDVEPQGHRS